ncbi:MAG: helix-turn-helix domain-containing protein [Haloarculaceae archaeon]
MKYVRLSLFHEPSVRHPMHQFVVERDGYEASYLLEGNHAGEVQTLLFHVDGYPPGPYERALAEVETIVEYAVSPAPDDTFFVYVRDRISPEGRDLLEAFTQVGLVAVGPVVYRSDGTAEFTIVGPAEVVQRAMDESPDGIDVDVLAVGEYSGRRLAEGGDLTDRQFEAVAAAVECGYYDDPRRGSVADVAAELDCAPGTAAEHLRRAEKAVMTDLVETR